MRFIATLLLLGLANYIEAAPSVKPLLSNGGFESGVKGWRPLWCRKAGAGTLSLDQKVVHSETNSARIDHSGPEDWSFEPELRVTAKAGDIFEWEAWVRLEGSGSATLCFSTWDGQGRNLSWSTGEKTIHAGQLWQHLRSRIVVASGVAQLQPRLIGQGQAIVWLDDCELIQKPGVDSFRSREMPRHIGLTNDALFVSVDTRNATLSVLDRRTGRNWEQDGGQSDLVVAAASGDKTEIQLTLVHVPSASTVKAILRLEAAVAEFTVRLTGTGELSGPLRYPLPFTSKAGDRLVVPLNEGISFPVEDPSVEPIRLIAYGGHGICMGFWGMTDDQAGYGSIFETPDDAAIQILRIQNRLAIAPEWDAQKGQFGYERRLRYVFFDKGGHVAIAKRYRKYAREIGLLRTLEEKRRENPNVDLLIGAVNVWNWDSDPVELVKEMQAAGIERVLWSRGGSAEQLSALNTLKVLTSRYDIYQDTMDPAIFPFLRGIHPDWTTAAWPRDIVLQANGDWLRGWGVQGKNGNMYYCGVLCDSRALDYAQQRIPEELNTHPYKCRFIDTTTAAPWQECYSTNHPMTRSESRRWKMKLLEYVSQDMKLVTGCETGHDAAVPFLHYFEGMLSLGPFRVPDAGRDIQRIWNDPPPQVVQFQLGQKYRLPLWELVYHECVVAQWYWGDYNNKLPSLWDKRDLFNALYGTPPMFMFDRNLWRSQKERFVRSYRNTCPFTRATGYAEMTDHRFLTTDRDVQQTVFANGVTITVNFGSTFYQSSTGQSIAPMGFAMTGMAPTEH